MSKLSDLIFGGKDHYITSPYGQRKTIKTSAGDTSNFHNGVDYGTNGKKLTQYAIADGEIINCGTDTAYGNALFVWIGYPELGVKMLHYHLDSIKVKKGQKVKKGTALGTTGKTGKATGIHLHLGIKKLSGGDYFDAEKWSKDVFEKAPAPKSESQKVQNYEVTATVLNVRSDPSLKGRIKTYTELTSDAQKKIKALKGTAVNGYVKGMKFTSYETVKADGHTWGRTPSGWVALEYCKKV